MLGGGGIFYGIHTRPAPFPSFAGLQSLSKAISLLSVMGLQVVNQLTRVSRSK